MVREYSYGVMLNALGKAVLFVRRKKGLPVGTVKHATTRGSVREARELARQMLIQGGWEGVPLEEYGEPELPIRTYLYGIRPENNRYQPFIVRKERDLPEGAIEISEHVGTADEALILARGLLHKRRPSLDPPVPESEPFDPDELRPGSVVCHVDSDGQHMGVCLKEDSPGMWSMVFFTSSPYWAECCRAATSDEIALAGLKTTKKTFLAWVTRYSAGFIPTGNVYPEHRVEDLLRELVIILGPGA